MALARQKGIPLTDALEIERNRETRPPTNSGAKPRGGWLLPIGANEPDAR